MSSILMYIMSFWARIIKNRQILYQNRIILNFKRKWIRICKKIDYPKFIWQILGVTKESKCHSILPQFFIHFNLNTFIKICPIQVLIFDFEIYNNIFQCIQYYIQHSYITMCVLNYIIKYFFTLCKFKNLGFRSEITRKYIIIYIN